MPGGSGRICSSWRTAASAPHWELRRPVSETASENQANASGDEVAPPVIEIRGIVGIRNELEVAGFVAALGIPLAKNVAQASPHRVAIVEIGMRDWVERGHGHTEARSEFRLALSLHECA